MKTIVLAISLTLSYTQLTSAKSMKDMSPQEKAAKRLKSQQVKMDQWENENYLPLSAKNKQEILWEKIVNTKHKNLPEFDSMEGPGAIKRVFGMATQYLTHKVEKPTDFAPAGWKKYIHRRGVVAKVIYLSHGNHPFTGAFNGIPHALLRLSLTYHPKKSFAPGLALKVLRDGAPSANVSALYTLSGQGQSYNFMENPLSNIVPVGQSIGEWVIHKIFSKVAKYPEELRMEHMASFSSDGKEVHEPIAPRQIFFVPNEEISFSKSRHDMREDFLSLKPGTKLYTVYSAPRTKDFQEFHNYQIKDIDIHKEKAVPIGEIVTTSEFIASEFGDTGIFFKHEAK